MVLHPIVAQMHPSDNQKPAIAERDRDVLVVAGAGTGKTLTLVARYLSLLAEGYPLRSVVAITFTRKAAWEMRNRVRAEVDKFLRRDDLIESDRTSWREVYTGLDAARIGTIHSLCTEVLRTHPAEAEVDPRFEVLEEGHANIQIQCAIDDAMAWVAESSKLVPLFAVLGEKDLRDTLNRLMHRRLDALFAFEHLPDDLLGEWQRQLRAQQERGVETLCGNQEWIAAVGMLEEQVALSDDDKAELQRRFALGCVREADAAAVRGELAGRLSALSRLNGINLSGGRQGNWPGGKEQLQLVKDALKGLRELWKRAKPLLELGLVPADEKLAECLPPLREVFRFTVERYDGFKQSQNVLDFDDLEREALAVLTRWRSVRAHWQQEIRSVLVDEFQDTNLRQRDMVRQMCGTSGKLFVVGDAKQSIYRFRGADITVFRREERRISQEDGIVLPLDVSYRAHRDLLGGLNDLLGPVLGEEDEARPWVEPFAPLSHHRLEAAAGFSAPYVEMHFTVGRKADGALERSANALVARLVDLVESQTCVVTDHGRGRPLCYGDIAILCRASTSFTAYENALDGRAPFLTVAGRGFYGRPEIRDLLNALRALADPTDDLALMGLLRSPAFGLTDAGLYRLRALEDGASLWRALQQDSPSLGDERETARRAVEIIRELHGQVGRTAVALILKQLLDRTHYRAALIKAGLKRGALNVSKLLIDAHESGIVSVGGFLEYVASLRDSGAREGEARDAAEGAVQIMSVHAAKGLEFPVVVLGDVTYGRQSRSGPLVDPILGVLLPLCDEEENLSTIYRLGKLREDDQEAAEADRLFYVAATRAREMLILSGYIDLKSDGMPGRLSGWLEPLAEPLGLDKVRLSEYDEAGGRAIRVDLNIGASPVACTVYEPNYAGVSVQTRLVPAVEAPIESMPVIVEPIVLPEATPGPRTDTEDRDPPRRVWQVVPTVRQPRVPAWVIGSIVHESLAAWRFPDESFESWAEARAHQYGVTDPRQLHRAAQESRRLMLAFREHTLFAEMVAAERRLHEVPFSLEIDGRTENGTIDALYFDAGRWTIVEFKTDSIKAQHDFERLLSDTDYNAQTERYVLAVQRLLGVTPRVILCLMNYNGTIRLETDLHTRRTASCVN